MKNIYIYVFSLRFKEGVDDRDLSEIGRLFNRLEEAIEEIVDLL